jgi:imidazole glycerol-phosphate synthase subunit HisH
MARLGEQGLVTPILEWVRAGRPFLGICLGMQLLFETSEEFGIFNGLGVIRGHVRRLPVVSGLKIPNIGWSSLEAGRLGSPESDAWAKTVLEGLRLGQDMYFVHSYSCYPEVDDTWLASTAYGDHEFCSVVQQGNVIACQFHPEKSGKAGLVILARCMNM